MQCNKKYYIYNLCNPLLNYAKGLHHLAKGFDLKTFITQY